MAKKKKKVGAITKNKKKKLLVGGAVVAAAGVAAYLWYKKATDTGSTTVVNADNGGNGGSTTAAAVDPAIAIQPLPNDTTIYNLLWDYDGNWRYAVDRMSYQERKDLYTYIWAYVKKGLHLYQNAGTYADGFYNPNLYTSISNLSQKWNLGLLY